MIATKFNIRYFQIEIFILHYIHDYVSLDTIYYQI